MNPFQVVQDFERALCEYTGAKYAVVTTSCTMAILLVCAFWRDKVGPISVTMPSRSYVGVPQSIIHAGLRVGFRNENWSGGYQIMPLPVWDYARRFTSGMYVKGQMQLVSFHWTKILSVGQGGAVLHDNPEADAWLRRARFDGRTEGVLAKEDIITQLGYHAYMSPRDAAEGISMLAVLPKYNHDVPNSDYPDLSKMSVFQCN